MTVSLAESFTRKYGPQFELRPAVVAAFGAERLGLELDADTLGKGAQGQAGEALAEDVRELYERLLQATEEATRYKALNAAESDHYQGELARLQHERDAAQAKAEEAAAEIARLRGRGFFARVFGSK